MYLQADDALARLHLLLVEGPLLFVGVLDADVHPGLAALGLCLRKQTEEWIWDLVLNY